MIHRWRQLTVLVTVLAGIFAVPPAWSQLLTVELSGIDGELRENTLAWLGDEPETAQARANYLFSVEDRVIQSLQALGYYRPDVRLQIRRDQSPWTLTVNVDAGEPVRLRTVDVRIEGEGRDDPVLLEWLTGSQLQAGEVLNHQVYENARRSLTALGRQRGYFDARFALARVEVEASGGTADVFLHYQSGPRYAFGPLVYNQEIIREDLLQSLLTVVEGEAFDQQHLARTQVQLQRTGYFSTVILRPDLEKAHAGIVPINLDLIPAKRHSVDLGAGFSTDTRERLSVTWSTPKLNRHGHSLETRLQYSPVNPSGRITYSIPMRHPLDDVVQVTARVEDNEFGDLDSNQKELGVRREKRRDSWVYSYALRGLNESWNAEGLYRESDYLLPGLSLSRRQRDGLLVNPTSGFSQWYRLEGGHSELGSDLDLLRASANFGYIHSLGNKHRFVLRSDLGAVFVSDRDREQLAPSLNFFAGGSQSIRGYSYQSIGNEITVSKETGEAVELVVGGERLFTASLEYQHSFTDRWRGAVFVDGGDAFDEGEFDLHVGAGFGLHYVTQVGAIRLELANPVTDDDPSWRLHVAIGAEF